MRIIAISTIKSFWQKNPSSEQPLRAWVQECIRSEWNNSAELKAKHRSASIINSKRVVFNIKGNDYRMIVDIEYKLKLVFIIWLGDHKDYDKLDVKKIAYGKTNKK